MFYVVKKKGNGELFVVPINWIENFPIENVYNSGYSKRKTRTVFLNQNITFAANFDDAAACFKATIVEGFRKCKIIYFDSTNNLISIVFNSPKTVQMNHAIDHVAFLQKIPRVRRECNKKSTVLLNETKAEAFYLDEINYLRAKLNDYRNNINGLLFDEDELSEILEFINELEADNRGGGVTCKSVNRSSTDFDERKMDISDVSDLPNPVNENRSSTGQTDLDESQMDISDVGDPTEIESLNQIMPVQMNTRSLSIDLGESSCDSGPKDQCRNEAGDELQDVMVPFNSDYGTKALQKLDSISGDIPFDENVSQFSIILQFLGHGLENVNFIVVYFYFI